MIYWIKCLLLIGAVLAVVAPLACAQQPLPPRVLTVSPLVGDVIDQQEKIRYGLFNYYAADDFQEARFLQFISQDSTAGGITLQTTLRNGDIRTRPFTRREFEGVRQLIETRAQELERYHSQISADSIGSAYSVELISGSSFIGILEARRDNELEFSTKDLGRLRVQQANIRRMELLSGTQRQRGWESVGNGTRIFFAPTARNLRKGEGYVQDIDIFLLGANYGITDNVSVGVLVPVLPGVGLNVFAVTPKASFAVRENLHVGAGVLYATAFGESGGIAYGLSTYGTADNNVTLGLGYAVGSGGGETSPVVLVGGATRISRIFSLLNETYILNGFVGGFAGVRAAATRLSGSLGFVYGNGVGGIYPAYVEVVYRFGRVR